MKITVPARNRLKIALQDILAMYVQKIQKCTGKLCSISVKNRAEKLVLPVFAWFPSKVGEPGLNAFSI